MRRGCLALAIVVAQGCGLSVIGSASNGALDGGGSDAGPTTSDVFAADEASALDARDDEAATLHAQTALGLDAGSHQYVDFQNIPIPANFTVEAWIRPASTGEEMMIVSEDRTLNTSDQFRFALTQKGTLYFAMSDKDSNYFGLMDYQDAAQFALESKSAVPVGAWSHVAVTKNGADFALLVDGTIVSTFTATGATFARGTAWSFRIGARMGSGGPDNYFDGTVDEIRLFDVARSPAEILADMKTELVTTRPAFARLVAYWRFDEEAGPIAHDDKKQFDGTLKNGASWVPSDAF